MDLHYWSEMEVPNQGYVHMIYSLILPSSGMLFLYHGVTMTALLIPVLIVLSISRFPFAMDNACTSGERIFTLDR